MIIGIDPGESNAAAFTDPFGLLTRSFGQYSYTLPLIVGIDSWGLWQPGSKIVTELQWLQGVKNKRGILSLAFDAGVMLGRLCEQFAAPGYALPVEVWKGLLFDGARSDKHVHSRRIERLLTPSEALLLPEGPRRWDALSAVGIAWAACLLGSKLEGYQRC